MTSLFSGPPGSTPIEPDDQAQLIPTWIATRGDLNSAEQVNIVRAATWLSGRAWSSGEILTQDWLKGLHARMLGDVWSWAGRYRHHETNLGVAPADVAVSVEALLADARAQIANGPDSAWAADEVAVRFHHRLVSIHPFVNGNGRHARLAGDALAVALGESRFSWGGDFDLNDPGAVREEYLAALRAADAGDIAALLRFAQGSPAQGL